MAAFYRYSLRDFVEIVSNDLQVGDEIAYAYGGDGKYGAIPITRVARIRGVGLLIQYILPVGAIAESDETNQIAVYWKGNKPDIHISHDINFNDRILILRK